MKVSRNRFNDSIMKRILKYKLSSNSIILILIKILRLFSNSIRSDARTME